MSWYMYDVYTNVYIHTWVYFYAPGIGRAMARVCRNKKIFTVMGETIE